MNGIWWTKLCAAIGVMLHWYMSPHRRLSKAKSAKGLPCAATKGSGFGKRFKVVKVGGDGHCLYKAVACLPAENNETSFAVRDNGSGFAAMLRLRKLTAAHIQKKVDEATTDAEESTIWNCLTAGGDDHFSALPHASRR